MLRKTLDCFFGAVFQLYTKSRFSLNKKQLLWWVSDKKSDQTTLQVLPTFETHKHMCYDHRATGTGWSSGAGGRARWSSRGQKPVRFPSQGSDLWIGAFSNLDFFSKETVRTRLAVQRTSCAYEQICPNHFGSGRSSMFSTRFPDVFCIPVSPAAASSQKSYISCKA